MNVRNFQELCYQENLLLGEYDICLSNVDTLYLLSGDKKRRLLPGQRVPERVKVLFVLCKVSSTLCFFRSGIDYLLY